MPDVPGKDQGLAHRDRRIRSSAAAAVGPAVLLGLRSYVGDATCGVWVYPRAPEAAQPFHLEHELTMVRGFAGTRVIGDRVSAFNGCDLVLLPPGMSHSWTVAPRTSTAGAETLVLLFTRDSLGRDLLARRDCQAIAGLLDRAGRGLAFTSATATAVEPLLREMTNAAPGRRLGQLLILLDLLASDAAEPIASAQHHGIACQEDLQRLDRLIAFVAAHLSGPIALAQAAEALGMPVATFTRFLRRVVGASFVPWLTHWRIEQARRLLRSGDDAVADIATRVGFHNADHFHRTFRALTGCTPRGWRE